MNADTGRIRIPEGNSGDDRTGFQENLHLFVHLRLVVSSPEKGSNLNVMDSTTLENPLRQGIRLERTADPCIVVIFGASGDLTKRKLVPALYRLVQQRLVPAEFAIVGLARTELSDDEFRDKMKEAIAEFSDSHQVDEEIWQSFARGLYYITADIGNPDDYGKLIELLDRVDRERGTAGNRLFYLSVAPRFYAPAVEQLGRAGLAQPKEGKWVRVVVEKPFGTDLASAQLIN